MVRKDIKKLLNPFKRQHILGQHLLVCAILHFTFLPHVFVEWQYFYYESIFIMRCLVEDLTMMTPLSYVYVCVY